MNSALFTDKEFSALTLAWNYLDHMEEKIDQLKDDSSYYASIEIFFVEKNVFRFSYLSEKFTTNLNKQGYYSDFIGTMGSIVEWDNPDLIVLKYFNKLAAHRGFASRFKTKYHGQPNHQQHIPDVFKFRNKLIDPISGKKLNILGIETSILARDKASRTYLKGCLDGVGLGIDPVGKTVYIFDYKPDLNFDFKTRLITKHVVDSIPQVSGYALAFKLLHEDELNREGYDVKVYTYNDQNGIIYDPKVAFGEFTKMYYGVTGNDKIPWKWLL